MLASDLNNPEFVNPANPDDVLHVEFYIHAALDWNKSQAEGKEIRLSPIPYVRIMKPGDNTSIIETPVRDDHKARWPQKWLAFQMKEGMIEGQIDVPGWKIEDWPVINPDQVHELKYLRFSTVEQIAGASDTQIQRLGIGGIGLREQARQALKEKYRAESNADLEARDRQIAHLQAQLSEIAEKLQSAPQPDVKQHKRHLTPERIEKMLAGRREKKQHREQLKARRKAKQQSLEQG